MPMDGTYTIDVLERTYMVTKVLDDGTKRFLVQPDTFAHAVTYYRNLGVTEGRFVDGDVESLAADLDKRVIFGPETSAKEFLQETNCLGTLPPPSPPPAVKRVVVELAAERLLEPAELIAEGNVAETARLLGSTIGTRMVPASGPGAIVGVGDVVALANGPGTVASTTHGATPCIQVVLPVGASFVNVQGGATFTNTTVQSGAHYVQGNATFHCASDAETKEALKLVPTWSMSLTASRRKWPMSATSSTESASRSTGSATRLMVSALPNLGRIGAHQVINAARPRT